MAWIFRQAASRSFDAFSIINTILLVHAYYALASINQHLNIQLSVLNASMNTQTDIDIKRCITFGAFVEFFFLFFVDGFSNDDSSDAWQVLLCREQSSVILALEHALSRGRICMLGMYVVASTAR